MFFIIVLLSNNGAGVSLFYYAVKTDREIEAPKPNTSLLYPRCEARWFPYTLWSKFLRVYPYFSDQSLRLPVLRPSVKHAMLRRRLRQLGGNRRYP